MKNEGLHAFYRSYATQLTMNVPFQVCFLFLPYIPLASMRARPTVVNALLLFFVSFLVCIVYAVLVVSHIYLNILDACLLYAQLQHVLPHCFLFATNA